MTSSPLPGQCAIFSNISLIVTVEGMMTIFRNYQVISAFLGEYSQQVSLFHLSLPQVRLPVDSPRTLRRVSYSPTFRKGLSIDPPRNF